MALSCGVWAKQKHLRSATGDFDGKLWTKLVHLWVVPVLVPIDKNVFTEDGNGNHQPSN